MSAKVPVVRQTNWLFVIPQLLLLGAIIYAWYWFDPKNGFLFGAITYLLISYSLRNFIPRDHRSGMRKVKSEKFEDAIAYFHKSYDYFQKHEWIDRYRFLTMLDPSHMCYQEMALINIAFCYSQMGDGVKAKEYYERTLKEFPENAMAKAALNMIASVEQTNSE